MNLAICREDMKDKSIIRIESLCWEYKGLLQRAQMYLILILFELLSISCAKKTILLALLTLLKSSLFTFLQALHIKYFSTCSNYVYQFYFSLSHLEEWDIPHWKLTQLFDCGYIPLVLFGWILKNLGKI